MLEKRIAVVEGGFITANVAAQLTRPCDLPIALNSILSTVALTIGSSYVLLRSRSIHEDGQANWTNVICNTASERVSDFMEINLMRNKLCLRSEACFALAQVATPRFLILLHLHVANEAMVQ